MLYRIIRIWYTGVDGWAVTFGTARRGLGGMRPRPGRAAAPASPLLVLAVPNVTAHPSTPVYQIRIIRYSTIAFGV